MFPHLTKPIQEISVHCAICDKDDDLITFDVKRQQFTPCGTCQSAIQDCLDGYGDDEELEPDV